MAVLREFRCSFHDHEFESTDERPDCPFGCDAAFVLLEFRTPPRIRHANTGITDTLTKQLASDYNLTDIHNDKDGSSVMSRTRRESGGSRVIGEQPAIPYWGNHFTPQQGWAQRAEPTPQFKPPADWTCAAVPAKAIQQGSRDYLRKATAYVGPKK